MSKEKRPKVDGTVGFKLDEGKNRLDLIPAGPWWKVGLVYTYGRSKYYDRNWEAGMAWSRCYGAVLRHMFKWMMGEKDDPETGIHHLAHAVFGLLALMEYDETHPELDDRPGSVDASNPSSEYHKKQGKEKA